MRVISKHRSAGSQIVLSQFSGPTVARVRLAKERNTMLDILTDDLAAPVAGPPKGVTKTGPSVREDTQYQFGDKHGDAPTALGRPASTAGRVEAGAEAHEEVGQDPAEAAEE